MLNITNRIGDGGHIIPYPNAGILIRNVEGVTEQQKAGLAVGSGVVLDLDVKIKNLWLKIIPSKNLRPLRCAGLAGSGFVGRFMIMRGVSGWVRVI